MITISRPRLLTYFGIAFGTGSIAVVVASAAGYRSGIWPLATALWMAQWAVYASIGGLALSVVGIAGRRGNRLRLWLGLLGTVASMPLIATGFWWEYTARTHPPINDVSTDIDDPPVFWETPNPSDYPTKNAVLQRAAYPDVVSVLLAAPPGRVFAQASIIVGENGWQMLVESKDNGRIEAVARSLLFGFPDEIVIRVAADEKGTKLDIRSRSRIGNIDRGMNARRIRAFVSALRAKLD